MFGIDRSTPDTRGVQSVERGAASVSCGSAGRPLPFHTRRTGCAECGARSRECLVRFGGPAVQHEKVCRNAEQQVSRAGRRAGRSTPDIRVCRVCNTEPGASRAGRRAGRSTADTRALQDVERAASLSGGLAVPRDRWGLRDVDRKRRAWARALRRFPQHTGLQDVQHREAPAATLPRSATSGRAARQRRLTPARLLMGARVSSSSADHAGRALDRQRHA